MLIKNKPQLIKNAKTKKIQKLRRDILEGLEYAIEAVDPYVLIKNNLKLRNEKLSIANKLILNLKDYKNIYVLGAGKATFMMARGLQAVLGNKIKEGFINVLEIPRNIELKKIKVAIASHPCPNKAGVLGTKKILELARRATKEDLVFVLISGGGSSLMSYPASGISLEDKIAMNELLIKSQAAIQEINCVRKHISAIKGGLLARVLYPAKVICLYLSDVVGDDLSSIASGPCVPDKTTFFQAIKILKKYKLWKKTPKNIKKYLLKGLKNKNLETPKPNNKIFSRFAEYGEIRKGSKFNHFILGSNIIALTVMRQEFKKRRYNCEILTDRLEGEIHNLSKKFILLIRKLKNKKFYNLPSFSRDREEKQILKILKNFKDKKPPLIILAGGEMTLKLHGQGFGGRNQELVMVTIPNIPKNVVFASFNTDGVDGRSTVPVAGGICDEWTYMRSQKLGLKIKEYIENNDSYLYLNKLNEVILTGKTGTNVGDIVIIGIV